MTKDMLKRILVNAVDNGIDEVKLSKIQNLEEFRWVGSDPIAFNVFAREKEKFGQKEENPLVDITVEGNW